MFLPFSFSIHGTFVILGHLLYILMHHIHFKSRGDRAVCQSATNINHRKGRRTHIQRGTHTFCEEGTSRQRKADRQTSRPLQVVREREPTKCQAGRRSISESSGSFDFHLLISHTQIQNMPRSIMIQLNVTHRWNA